MKKSNRNRRLLPLLLVLVLTLALLPPATAHAEYFPRATSQKRSLTEALASVGYTVTYREQLLIAAENLNPDDYVNYRGTAEQNLHLLLLLESHALKIPPGFPDPIPYQTHQTYQDQAAPSLADVTGVAQQQDMCTSCSMTVLLRRAQYLDKCGTVTFSFADVRAALGSVYRNGSWSSVNFYFEGVWTSSNGDRYRTRYCARPKSAQELANLLDQNPAGVILYATYRSGMGKHSILVSDYEWTASGYRFYAYDPAMNSGNRTELEQSLLYRFSSNKDGSFASLQATLDNVIVAVIAR